MQTAKQYVPHIAVCIEHALNRMPVQTTKPEEYIHRQIICDVETLLTAEEQRMCDIATD